MYSLMGHIHLDGTTLSPSPSHRSAAQEGVFECLARCAQQTLQESPDTDRAHFLRLWEARYSLRSLCHTYHSMEYSRVGFSVAPSTLLTPRMKGKGGGWLFHFPAVVPCRGRRQGAGGSSKSCPGILLCVALASDNLFRFGDVSCPLSII